ncbi:sensor histidine kinase [Paenibacillus sp. HB172176]|uniref:sensor histidine kinase n=1 Tax=Paenibacillus sp. HB172176 TaxID=2493690 RepID=UPI0014394D65|nr:sensor histidine kinase [Paenibacillus sp. HB172176]
MRLWRFFRYERPYLVVCAAVFLLTVLIFATDPEARFRWQNFFYALALVVLLLAGFFLYRYASQSNAIRGMKDGHAPPQSLEAEACRDALEEQEISHIRALNTVQAKQKEHYDFIMSWFHEIKTPIAVLRLMQQTEIDAKSLEEELSRIEYFVDQALYYAKLDDFNQDYEITRCELEQTVKQTVKLHAKTFISKKIKLHLQLQPMNIQSDSKWLLFIVNQIITNALKYTPAQGDGEIIIKTAETAADKQLIIEDNGIGIEPKDLPRIFNRGFTGSNGRIHTKSTGMGLYLAQELSRKLGHYITCESAPGGPTVFTIHFPRNHDLHLSVLQRGSDVR